MGIGESIMAMHPFLNSQTRTPLRKIQDVLDEGRPCLNRDMTTALTPVSNRLPEGYVCSWSLQSRPRRIALLIDDAQLSYQDCMQQSGAVGNIKELIGAFRDQGCQIAWSYWSRSFEDGISNSSDRWFGGDGIQDQTNGQYTFGGEHDMQSIPGLCPNAEELASGAVYRSKQYDMFWTFGEDGLSYLDERLKKEGIDTVVVAGSWSEYCIIATVIGAFMRGYDVVVAEDCVATPTTMHKNAMDGMKHAYCQLTTSEDLVEYMKTQYVQGDKGAVKGIAHPDGRKDNSPGHNSTRCDQTDLLAKDAAVWRYFTAGVVAAASVVGMWSWWKTKGKH